MDRSSMHKVESTDDEAKRLAFKALLANKIEPPQSKELPAVDNTFNGVAPGGKLIHPSLGEGILVEVDYKNNEVLIDFAHKGLIGLVLTQAKSFVHSPHKEEAKIIDDPFIGEKIERLLPDRSDSVTNSHKLTTEKIFSPDFIEPEKAFFPVGSSVWHPDLGNCTVLSVDENANKLTVNAANNTIDLVLSQVRSILRPIETALDHVPMKPLIREKLAPQVSQYKSRGDVSVSIPEVFKSWQRNQQFMFLTRSQNLTTDQANDVFSVLDGNKPMFHSVVISWQTEEETQANIIPGLKKNLHGRLVKELPSILSNKNLWHPDFGACSVATVEGNNLVLMTSVGQIPCVLDVTVPKLAVLDTTAKVEHAPKRLGTREFSPAAIKEVQPKNTLILPVVFNSWKIKEQYQYLTGNSHLTAEDANDFLAGSADKFDIQWTDSHPEVEKRSEFKDQLLKRVEAASVEPVISVAPKAIDPGLRRVVEEVITSRKETIQKLSIELPKDFKSWTSSGQYVYLTRTRQLTFNEANDVMDVLSNKLLKSKTQYEVIWTDGDSAAYASNTGVQRASEEVIIEDKNPVLKRIVVTLPNSFKTCSESTQYSFLTRARQLTFSEANEAMNAINNKPFNSKVEYEIIWSE